MSDKTARDIFKIHIFNIRKDELSKITNIPPLPVFELKTDPVYILNLKNLNSEEFSSLIQDPSNDHRNKIEFVPITDEDYTPKRIKRRHLSKKIIHIVQRYYKADKSNETYYLENRLENDESRKIHYTLKESDFDIIYFETKFISRNSGMFYYNMPKDVKGLDEDLIRIKRHRDSIKSFRLPDAWSFLYAGMLNRMDYGVSTVNKKRIIIYANLQRRKRFGHNILGEYCYKAFAGKLGLKKCANERGNFFLNCQMNCIIEGNPIFKKQSRQELHKLWSDKDGPYSVSETGSLLEVKNHESGKIERLGINVVRKNTFRILPQEFQKLIQGLDQFEDILKALRYILIGGSEANFRKDFENIFNESQLFNDIVDRLSYQEKDGDRQILSFGFSRFRYYRRSIDIFNESYKDNTVQDFKGVVLQIYDAYDQKGRVEEHIGKVLDFNKNLNLARKAINEKVPFYADPKRNFELTIQEKIYLNEIGLFRKEGDQDKRMAWVNFPMFAGEDLIGMISVDWIGNEKYERLFQEEIRESLFDFTRFVARAIKESRQNMLVKLTHDLTRIIMRRHETIEGLYYRFAEKLCEMFNALKFELYLKEGIDEIDRKYVYYSELDKKKCEEIKNKIVKRISIGKGLTGNIFKIITDSTENGKSEIHEHEKCIAVLNYNDYNKYFEHEPEKQVNQEFKQKEENLVSGPDFLNKDVPTRNCLIAPIQYKGETLGLIKISNNLYEGRIFFPVMLQRMLLQVSDQLAIQIDNYFLKEREKHVFQIFRELSELLHKSSDADIDDGEILDEIKKIMTLLFRAIKPEKHQIFIAASGKKKLHNELYQIFLESTDKNAMKNYWFCKTKLEKKRNKNIIRYNENKDIFCNIKKNKNTIALIFCQNHMRDFNTEDEELIKAVVQQIEVMYIIRDLKKKSIEIMQNIAHQVISPLKGFETHCKNLIRSMLHPEDPNHFKYKDSLRRAYVMQLLLSQTTHVRFLVSSLQNFLDLELGKKIKNKIKNLNLIRELIYTVSIYQPIAREQGIKKFEVTYNGRALTGNENAFINFDDLLLAQIFGGIADNAVKYSYKGQSITMDISRYLENAEYYYVIKTTNKGIIIDRREWDAIFSRKYRTKIAKKWFEQGTGIGLYLARTICEEFNGKCFVENSDTEKGTTITVKLPSRLYIPT